ncbi:hypothetical protein Tco_1281032 [Tanacetum coccineum]
MPTRKIGIYTRFFEYANFRLPLSTFLVNVLRHYHINLSQLSVIAAAKVSHFKILCRVYNIEPTVGLFRCFYMNSKNKGWISFSKRPNSDAVCYTKPLDSLKHWNDHFFWVDFFAFLASFSWHTSKNVSKDPFPKSTEFNTDHYVILVAHLAPFRKFPKPFLCLVGMSRYYTLDEDTYPSFLHDDGMDMDLLAFIHVANPTKVKFGKRERAKGEAKLLDSIVGHVVPLLPVALARADSELEASVDRIIADVTVVAEKPKRPRKKRQAITDASGSFHPPKKLNGDHETSSGAATGGKYPFILKELLASSMLNVKVGVQAMATLPLVTSSVSATPDHENGVPTDSITWLNLCTIGASERFVISSDSSYHSSTNASRAEVGSVIRSAIVPPVMTEAVITSHAANSSSVLVPKTGTKIPSPVHASMFHDSYSTETMKADIAGPSYSVKQDLSMGSRELNSETLHQVFVSRWNIREMDYHHLFIEFNVGTARQACLNAEVRMRTEYCLSSTTAEETEAAHLRTQVSTAKATEKMHAAEIDALKQRNVILENEKESLDGKVAELQSSVSTKESLDGKVVLKVTNVPCSRQDFPVAVSGLVCPLS